MANDALQNYRDQIERHGGLPPKAALDARGAELLGRIERAFADWPPNAGLTWVQGEMLDNYEPKEIVREGAHIAAYERWQDVPPELFATFQCAVWFLDDGGLNFYWPALMVWELQYGLTYEWTSPAEQLPEWSGRLRPRTEEQSQVFADYKKYISDRDQSTWL